MSYLIINYPKFKAFTSTGAPAVGYKVYSYAVGTTTPQVTYSERTLVTENSNPITLDAAGECVIYTNQAVKLVLKTDAAVTVWTFDYLAEQQDKFIISDTVTSTHNQYTVTSSPVVGALTENLTLMMTPDATNTTTLTSNVFNGTGVDDCTVGGAYTGTTSASVFRVEIDGAIEAAPTAPTAVETNDVGLVTVGNHYVKVSFVTAIGESLLSPASSVVASDGAETIDVSDIAVGSAQVTSRNVYMTEAGGTDYYLVDTIADNTTTTYTISIADATLAGNDPAPTADSTGTADTFKWRKDAGSWTTGVAITAAEQTLAEGVSVTFAVIAGHTLADYWAITVETPARVNLDGLGSLLVYKNKGGTIMPLGAADMVADYPAQLVLNAALSAWLLMNPATPVITPTAISAIRYRRTLSGNYNLLLADQGYELSFTATATLTLLTPPEFGNRFFYVHNAGTGVVTVDAGADYLIYGTGAGSRYVYVTPGGTYQLQTNGVDWHVMTSIGYPMLIAKSEPSAAASVTFSNLNSVSKYRLEMEITLSAAAHLSMTVNADTAAHYVSTVEKLAAGALTAGTSTTGFVLADTPDAATLIWGYADFQTLVSDDTIIRLQGRLKQDAMTTSLSDGYYDHTDTLSSVTLAPASGNMTGTVWLYQVG